MPKKTNGKSNTPWVVAIVGVLVAIGAFFAGYQTRSNTNVVQGMQTVMDGACETSKLCMNTDNKCNPACYPDTKLSMMALCIARPILSKSNDCLNLNASAGTTASDTFSAKLKTCIASNAQESKNFLEYLASNQKEVSQGARDAWHSQCSSAQDFIIKGELRGLPQGLMAEVFVALDRRPDPADKDGIFKVSVPPDSMTSDAVQLTVRAPGYKTKNYPISIKKYKETGNHQIIDFANEKSDTPESSISSSSNPSTFTCIGDEPVDYINQAKCPREEYNKALVLKEEDKPGNILADSKNEFNSTYRSVSMRPTLYGTSGNGNTITQEAGEPASFYHIKVADRCYYKGGYTHGGFYYFIDKEKTLPYKNYKISFYAWSKDADGLALRIQHSDGHGEVSNLSGTAMITKERKKFWWTGRLDGKQQNTPQRYLFGYLADYSGKRSCAPDPDHPEKFAGRSFVIGDVRLEMLPD